MLIPYSAKNVENLYKTSNKKRYNDSFKLTVLAPVGMSDYNIFINNGYVKTNKLNSRESYLKSKIIVRAILDLDSK